MGSALTCPYCDSARVKPQGRVLVAEGEVRRTYRCLGCGRDFDLTVRAAALDSRLTDDPPRAMAYVIRCQTCAYRVEHLTRTAAVDAAFRHCEATQHQGVAIEDPLDLTDRRDGGDGKRE